MGFWVDDEEFETREEAESYIILRDLEYRQDEEEDD